MGSIQLLSDDVVNKIAAGEVIERPASVVRELVDNAVDAEADQITISLVNGGHDLIGVTDNGVGIKAEDIELAFQCHATSKITKASDLEGISTLGFRGEALSSIAAVSKVTMRSRQQKTPVGCEVLVAGGIVETVTPYARPVGTEIEVRQLFYNTPARRKFLRTPRTEQQRVKRWLRQAALARPDIHYRLVCDERELVNMPPRESIIERAMEQLRGQTFSFSEKVGNIKVLGVIGHPDLAQGDGTELAILVNGRLIQDRMLQKAVRSGFRGMLKDREFPVGCVAIRLDSHLVDVNVHPQKSEVRFYDSSTVFRAVAGTVERALGGIHATSSTSDYRSEHVSPPTFLKSAPSWERVQSSQSSQPNLEWRQASGTFQAGQPNQVAESEAQYSTPRYIGQVLDCYLIYTERDELLIVDMHAAHERLNFNRIQQQYQAGQVPSQRLLVPVTVELTEEGLDNCRRHEAVLTRFGFEVEPFGDTTLIIRSLPAGLATDQAASALKDLAVCDLGELANNALEAPLATAAARLACHASVRSGDHLHRLEAEELLANLRGTEFGSACPHGRPVIKHFQRAEVERWFGRDH